MAMVWGWPSENYVVQIPQDTNVVMGYNEPNNREQVVTGYKCMCVSVGGWVGVGGVRV